MIYKSSNVCSGTDPATRKARLGHTVSKGVRATGFRHKMQEPGYKTQRGYVKGGLLRIAASSCRCGICIPPCGYCRGTDPATRKARLG